MKLLGVILYWIVVGCLLMLGMKAGDWLVPDAPREGLTVRLECEAASSPAPAWRREDGERDL